MADRRFAKNPDLFVEDMHEEMVLYEAGYQRAIYLNETAALVQGLIEMLVENYPDARADLPRDIESGCSGRTATQDHDDLSYTSPLLGLPRRSRSTTSSSAPLNGAQIVTH